jgi:hypothetical protein
MTLMRYTWRYIVFLEIFVIGRSAITFVANDSLSFHSGFKVMTSDGPWKHFVVVGIGWCRYR